MLSKTLRSLHQVALILTVIVGLLLWWGIIALCFYLGFPVVGIILIVLAFGSILITLFRWNQ